MIILQTSTDPSGPAFHVVMGNEACDVDSMVSALVYAYFLSKVSYCPTSCQYDFMTVWCDICLSVRPLAVRRSASRC